MSQFYKVLKADPLGDPWTPNFPDAKPIQNWWGQLEGVDKNVSIGKQVGNSVTPGEQIYGDLIYAKSQKSGNEYWKFKSAKVPDGVQRPASTPAQATAQAATGQPVNMSETMPGWFMPTYNMMLDIHKMLKDLHGGEDLTPELAPEPAKVESLGDEPLDPETQTMLDDIFTPTPQPETPEDV